MQVARCVFMDGFHLLTMKLVPLRGHIVIGVLGTELQVAILSGKKETRLISHLPITAEYWQFIFYLQGLQRASCLPRTRVMSLTFMGLQTECSMQQHPHHRPCGSFGMLLHLVLDLPWNVHTCC